ncbi:MAG: hypothetical protein WBD16_02410, partial [Pyrinomonadaceae bacterium]
RCLTVIFFATVAFAACSSRVETNSNPAPTVASLVPEPTPKAPATPAIPNLQAELLDDSNTSSKSPLAKFDFRSYTYELPRGWQNPDGTDEITLTNGRVDPIEVNENGRTTDKTKNKDKDKDKDKDKEDDATSLRRIGMTLVATKFFDVTGDGDDEAVVILKIETGGSAIPQIVYVFSWKNGAPELIWPFRTGDRADGGLKNIFAEGGNLVVELYGQDRFLLGQTETGKIGDDLEQLCCPTHFTRSVYKWNGKDFLLQGKRLTYLTSDPKAIPLENLGDKVNKQKK